MKILIGCPTCSLYDYCLEEYSSVVKKLEGDVLLVDNSEKEGYEERIKEVGLEVIKSPYKEFARERVVDGRNLLREKVLDEGYDYFLSLEQDVIPPKDVISKLLGHNVKVVSGLYSTPRVMIRRDSLGRRFKVKEDVPLAMVAGEPGKVRWMMPEEVKKERLVGVGGVGLGCILIHRDVLEGVKFRYSRDNLAFDDMWFCKDVRDNGWKVYLDTGVKCDHKTNRGWKWKDLKF
tara:strand:- start:82 stop:780 length:699 start_codon:yes stop_codon:yes gene_type:complete